MERFFGCGAGGDEVKVFGWGGEVGEEGCWVVDLDCYAGEEADVGVFGERVGGNGVCLQGLAVGQRGVGGEDDCGGEFAGVEDIEGDYGVAHFVLAASCGVGCTVV